LGKELDEQGGNSSLACAPFSCDSNCCSHFSLFFSDKSGDPLRIPAGTSVLKNFGGSIHLPHLFDYIEQYRSRAVNELDDVPVLQAVAEEKGLLAVVLTGYGFDVGNPAGYWAANLHSESKQLLRQNL